jgi:hypothetical protein
VVGLVERDEGVISGHYIHWEQPTLVIDAVRQVIEDVRSR